MYMKDYDLYFQTLGLLNLHVCPVDLYVYPVHLYGDSVSVCVRGGGGQWLEHLTPDPLVDTRFQMQASL